MMKSSSLGDYQIHGTLEMQQQAPSKIEQQ